MFSFLYKIYKNLETRDHHLLYLFLEITRQCNLSCLHCGSDCTSFYNGPVLSPESWLSIVDYIFRGFGKQVCFVITGGEPLLYPGLNCIGKRIHQHKMRWGMVTNGFALTREKCDELVDAGIYSITLSLDGMEMSHNYIRNNKHAFQKAKKALDLLGSSKVPNVDVVTCVYPKNIGELDDIASLLLDFNIKLWRLFRIFPSGRAGKNKEILLSFDQTGEMVDWVEKNRPLLKNHGLSVSLSCEGYLPFHRDRKVRDQPFFCRAGINIASILCDGTVTGCPNNDPTFYEGNIIKEDFIKMWLQGFSRFRKREWIKETECAGCSDCRNCMGGSIHLWELGKKKPRFCYVKDVI